jgi:hypothetical protein
MVGIFTGTLESGNGDRIYNLLATTASTNAQTISGAGVFKI